MNFQLLDPDFKDRLKKIIPYFAKKGFEERVGRTIESTARE